MLTLTLLHSTARWSSHRTITGTSVRSITVQAERLIVGWLDTKHGGTWDVESFEGGTPAEAEAVLLAVGDLLDRLHVRPAVSVLPELSLTLF